MDRPVTLANFAGDVVGLLDFLGVDQADMFGFSSGASLRPRRRSPNPPGRTGSCSHRATSGPTAATRPNLSLK
jgi:pimeloyl-ACP methyl ester carboxylesterase